MMWLYVPKDFIPYPLPQESEDSISEYDWRFQLLEQSAMWRSKPTRAKSWHRVWKTSAWMKRLFGRICEPLMASRGVEKWIASLEDIPASRSAMPDGGEEKTTRDISGLKSSESSKKSIPYTVFLKTLRDTSRSDSWRLQKAYERLVLRLRREYLARLKSARLTDEDDSSSWPTPDAGVINDGNDLENWQNRRDRIKAEKKNGNGFGIPLTMASQMWRTPSSSDDDGGVKDLNDPKYRDAKQPKIKLRDQVSTWATPHVHNYLGEPGEGLTKRGGHAKDLVRDVKNFGLQAHVIEKNGNESSNVTRRLNPRFAEWLMGWIPGWTHPCMPIDRNDFERWETELSRLLRGLLSLHYGDEYTVSSEDKE